MIAHYCFAERQKELFAEALTRGSVAAARDWPRPAATVNDAILACAYLRLETCCVEDEMAYRSLTESAWLSAYRAYHEQVLERDGVKLAFALRDEPLDEALAWVRPYMQQSERVQAEYERAYAQYLTALDTMMGRTGMRV